MAGPREDGTFAENKAHHPNRRVERSAQYMSVKKDRMYKYGMTDSQAMNDIDSQRINNK